MDISLNHSEGLTLCPIIRCFVYNFFALPLKILLKLSVEMYKKDPDPPKNMTDLNPWLYDA